MVRWLIFALLAPSLCPAIEQTQPEPCEPVLWRAPHAMSISDWVWGPGGEERAPVPPFQFVKENMGGTNPKVEIRDARGALWTVKFGGEAHTDVFTSRLLLAVGYFAEPTYFVRAGAIIGVAGLKRAKPFIAKDGRFRYARFKLRDEHLVAFRGAVPAFPGFSAP